MPNGTHIVHDQHPPPRFRRLWWLLGMSIGTASGVLVGWLLVN